MDYSLRDSEYLHLCGDDLTGDDYYAGTVAFPGKKSPGMDSIEIQAVRNATANASKFLIGSRPFRCGNIDLCWLSSSCHY